MSGHKVYVVWEGVKPGIYHSWSECEKQVNGYPGALYKSYNQLSDAEAAYASTRDKNEVKPKHKKRSSSNFVRQKQAVKTDIQIYTDGACHPNPGPAGTGLAVYHNGQLTELKYGCYHQVGTNNIAELDGLHEALKLAKSYINNGKTVTIYSDSVYAIKCITQWAISWKKNGWVKRDKSEIKNLQLIQSIYSLYLDISSNVFIRHVKGHAGIEGNELADRMSVLARRQKQHGLVPYTKTKDIQTILDITKG